MRVSDLEIFRVIADSKSLHRAAQRVGITQSAVSKTLSRLESQFGVRLLDRSKKGLELTEAGERLLQSAHGMHVLMDDMHADMAAMRSASSGAIRFGTHQSILCNPGLPALLGRVSEGSDLRVSLTLQTTDSLLGAILDGRLDLALCVIPPKLPDNLRFDNLGVQEFRIVVRRGHLILGDKPQIQDLSRVKWLLQPRGYLIRNLVDELFVRHSMAGPAIGIETDVTTSLLSSVVRETDLVSVFFEQVLSTSIARDIVPVEIDVDPPLACELGLFSRRASSMSPVVRKFREEVLAMFPGARTSRRS